MKREQPPVAPYATVIEHVAKLLAVIAALLLVLSVFYDYTYLSALGLSFDDVPSLTAEHVRSALLWVPLVAVVALISLGIVLLEPEEHEQQAESVAARRTKPSFFRTRANFAGFAAMFAVLSLLSPGKSWAFFLALIGGPAVVFYIATDARFRARFTMGKLLVAMFLPMLIAFVGLTGYLNGMHLAKNVTPKWELSVRVGTSISKRTLTGLRRFSSFAIAIDDRRFVSVIANDSILSVRRLDQLAVPQSNYCDWLGFWCKPGKVVRVTPLPSALKPAPARAPAPATPSP